MNLLRALARLLGMFRRRPSPPAPPPAPAWQMFGGVPSRDPTAAEIEQWQDDSVREIAERKAGTDGRWLSPRPRSKW